MLFKKIKVLINSLQKELILPSIVFILPLLASVYVNQNIPFTQFNRILGNAVVDNINVDARSKFIVQWMFFILPLCFFGIWSLLSLICDVQKKATYKTVSLLSAAAIVPIVYYRMQASGVIESHFISVLFLPIMAVVLLLIPTIKYISDYFEQNNDVYIWSVLASFPLYMYLIQLIDFKTIQDHKINQAVITFLIYAIIILLFTFLMYILGVWLRKHQRFYYFQKYYTITMCAPLIILILLEWFNILSFHGIKIPRLYLLVNVVYLLLFMVPVCLIFFKHKNKQMKEQRFMFQPKHYYLCIIIVFSCIIFSNSSKFVFDTVDIPFNFFETANAGNSLYGFLYHGKLPVVETFDAHMLYYQFGSILYYLVSGDKASAVIYGYSIIPLFMIFYYVLFQRIFGSTYAFIICFFTGAMINSTFVNMAPVAAAILMLEYVNRKNNYLTCTLFWLFTALCVLFRLDVGVAILVGSIVTWVIYFLFFSQSQNRIADSKRLVITLFATYVGLLMLFCLLCLVKSIHPIDRLKEFLAIVQSNNFWGTSNLGNPALVANMFYYVLPFVSIFMLGHAIAKRKQMRQEEKSITIITFLFAFGVFYANFQRGLIRHTLYEMTLVSLLGTFILFIAIYARVIQPKKVFQNMMLIVVLPLIFGLFITTSTTEQIPMYQYARIYSDRVHYQVQNPLEKGESRVTFTQDLKDIINPIKYLFDQTLEPQDTFLDFSNQSSMYFILQRENFMYANQSPGLISGEFAQQQFLQSVEAQGDRIKYAITSDNMPLGPNLDDLTTSYRYYLIAEHIYNDYVPFYKTHNFTIWCKKDKLEQQKAKMKKVNLDAAELQKADVQPATYDSFGEHIHQYKLGNTPFLWANYDAKANNPNVQLELVKKPIEGSTVEMSVDTTTFDKSKGNYLSLELENVQAKQNIAVDMIDSKTNKKLSTFSFSTNLEGQQKYMIRVSSDMYWFAKNEIKFQIHSQNPFEIKKATILKGDVLHEV